MKPAPVGPDDIARPAGEQRLGQWHALMARLSAALQDPWTAWTGSEEAKRVRA